MRIRLTAARGAADHDGVKRLSVPLGLICLATLLSALFVLALPRRLYWQRVLQDGGHGAVFVGVGIVLLLMRRGDPRSGSHRPADYVIAFFVAVALGVATEALQHYLPHRQVSALDVLHDAAGAALGLALVTVARSAAPSDRGAGRPVALLVALVALVVLGWEPVRCATAYAQRASAFPALAPLAGVAHDKFVLARNAALERAPLPEPWRRPDEADALRLAPTPGARPALELPEPVPDWRGHSALALDLTNPSSQPVRFVLRVLDAPHDWTHADRLNLPVDVPPRTRTVVRVPMAAIATAPAGRTMELSRIAHVMLFAPRPLDADAVYVSRIWLEDSFAAASGAGTDGSQMRRHSHCSALGGGRRVGTCTGVTATGRPARRSATTNENTNHGVCPMRRSVMSTGLPASSRGRSPAVAVPTPPVVGRTSAAACAVPIACTP